MGCFLSMKPQDNSKEGVLFPYLGYPHECYRLAVSHEPSFLPELMKLLHRSQCYNPINGMHISRAKALSIWYYFFRIYFQKRNL